MYHPKKPDQVRVVFDCSALYNSQSLNKNLLQGPDQLNSLIGVLTRFRKEDVALTCDMKQMFHSFHITTSHRDFLRFLWFENNDLDGAISEFRMNVHLFGAVSSPAVANYSLHKTAETGRAEFGDKAADFLCRHFYVDDGLTSVPTISEAIELIEDSQGLCASAKLRLHKFASNRKDVSEALPKDNRARDLKDLDLRHNALPVQRSLGTYWCIESDTLGFRIELKDKPLSRRGILSTISSVYDPLGIVSPVILTGKQILQDLFRQKVDWDDLLGQVSYLRTVNSKGEVHVSFLIAKSRVAPIKPISIPRMELTAAFVSVNITKMLQSELDYENLRSVYYTDSEVVIGYVSNEARRFTYMSETEYSTSVIVATRNSGITCQERIILRTKRLVHSLPVSYLTKRDGSQGQTFSGKAMYYFSTRKTQLSLALFFDDVEVKTNTCLLTHSSAREYPGLLFSCLNRISS